MVKSAAFVNVAAKADIRLVLFQEFAHRDGPDMNAGFRNIIANRVLWRIVGNKHGRGIFPRPDPIPASTSASMSFREIRLAC